MVWVAINQRQLPNCTESWLQPRPTRRISGKQPYEILIPRLNLLPTTSLRQKNLLTPAVLDEGKHLRKMVGDPMPVVPTPHFYAKSSRS